MHGLRQHTYTPRSVDTHALAVLVHWFGQPEQHNTTQHAFGAAHWTSSHDTGLSTDTCGGHVSFDVAE